MAFKFVYCGATRMIGWNCSYGDIAYLQGSSVFFYIHIIYVGGKSVKAYRPQRALKIGIKLLPYCELFVSCSVDR